MDQRETKLGETWRMKPHQWKAGQLVVIQPGPTPDACFQATADDGDWILATKTAFYCIAEFVSAAPPSAPPQAPALPVEWVGNWLLLKVGQLWKNSSGSMVEVTAVDRGKSVTWKYADGGRGETYYIGDAYCHYVASWTFVSHADSAPEQPSGLVCGHAFDDGSYCTLVQGHFPEHPAPPPVAAPSKGAALRVGERVRLLKAYAGIPQGETLTVGKDFAPGVFHTSPVSTALIQAADEGVYWERVPADNVCNDSPRAGAEPTTKESVLGAGHGRPNRRSDSADGGMTALDISEAVEMGWRGVAGGNHWEHRNTGSARALEARSVVDNAGDMLDLLEDV